LVDAAREVVDHPGEQRAFDRSDAVGGDDVAVDRRRPDELVRAPLPGGS